MKNLMYANISRVVLLCMGLCLLLTVPAYAQNVKPAVIDVKRILTESAAAKSIQAQLEDKRKDFQEEFSKHEQDLRETQTDLGDAENMSQEELMKKKQAFETKLFETKKLVEERRRNLEQAASNALTELRNEIVNVVAKMADEDGYNLVLTRQDVVLADKEMDITDEVMKKLDKSIKKIDLKLDSN